MVRGRWRVEVANLRMMLVVFCFQTLKNKKKACTLNLDTKNKKQSANTNTNTVTKNKVSNIKQKTKTTYNIQHTTYIVYKL